MSKILMAVSVSMSVLIFTCSNLYAQALWKGDELDKLVTSLRKIRENYQAEVSRAEAGHNQSFNEAADRIDGQLSGFGVSRTIREYENSVLDRNHPGHRYSRALSQWQMGRDSNQRSIDMDSYNIRSGSRERRSLADNSRRSKEKNRHNLTRFNRTYDEVFPRIKEHVSVLKTQKRAYGDYALGFLWSGVGFSDKGRIKAEKDYLVGMINEMRDGMRAERYKSGRETCFFGSVAKEDRDDISSRYESALEKLTRNIMKANYQLAL